MFGQGAHVGIDTQAQTRRLNRSSWATVALRGTVAADGKLREMVMVDSATIPMWLATIDQRRVVGYMPSGITRSVE